MFKVNLQLNDKFKIGLSIFFCITVLLFRYSLIVDYLATFVLLIILLFDLIKYSRINNTKSVFFHYFSWIIITSLVFFIRSVGLNFWSPIVLVLTLKIIVILVSILRYKNLYVTKTIFGYLWLVSLFLYLTELLLNSTHGLAKLCVNLAILSSIETVAIILIKKKQVIYEPSIIILIWNKVKKYLNHQT